MNLFTYGTLMDESIFSALTGCTLKHKPAWVKGYARHPVHDTCYPGVTPSENQTTSGILYFDLPESAWPVLDWFEDELYERKTISVVTSGGHQVDAQMYTVHSDNTSALDLHNEWSFSDFLRHHKPEYLTMCQQAPQHFDPS